MGGAYYNEIDKYCVAWLKNLISEGLIPKGDVDDRSIKDVTPNELTGYTHLHFFAGLGGWAHALRLANWSDSRPFVSGSTPCQPFSVAGKGGGTSDPRHLWPDFYRIIRGLRPPVVMGEQVAGKAGYGWFDGVQSDLEEEGYSCRAVDIPACSVNAPHIRNRLYWVADTNDTERGAAEPRGNQFDRETPGRDQGTGDAQCRGGAVSRMGNAESNRRRQSGLPSAGNPAPDIEWAGNRNSDAGSTGFWDDSTLVGPDPAGKYRRVKPGVRLLVDGVSGRVVVRRAARQGDPAIQEDHQYNRIGALKAFGNAINPQIAAEVIKAYQELVPYQLTN